VVDVASGGVDLAALDAVTAAMESGAGLPEVVRAAARSLETSMVVLDRAGHTLAVAARSPADERSLMSDAEDVEVLELRVADEVVGRLRVRVRADGDRAMLRIVTTLVASEVGRVGAPERASEEAAEAFVRDLLDRRLEERSELLARAEELGLELEAGGAVVVVHARPQVPADEGWRTRLRSGCERGARAAAGRAVSALADRDALAGAEIIAVVPGAEDAVGERAAEGILRELQAGLPGFVFAVGRSRVATDPAELRRAVDEARLAANVADGDPERPVLAFEDTGAYRLLLSAMSENPEELQRFYAETVEPLVAYDEQYETELVATLDAFLDADGNVAGTAQRLFTHRHTIRYRLERVRELSGLDVSSSDGREKLSLGLKAMRVLGIASSRGPATEAGTEAGRVPRRTASRKR
jgi:sugar diacid utilization regulator